MLSVKCYIWEAAATMVPCLRLAGNGLLVCRVDSSTLAKERESRLLLYQDMDSELDNLSCSERLAKADVTSKKPAIADTILDSPAMTPYWFMSPLSFLHTVTSSLFPHPYPPTVTLSQEEHNQTIPRQSFPTAWQILYADRYTCQVTQLYIILM